MTLRTFLDLLQQRGQLRRITVPVDGDLEIAEISNRMLQAGGPALLFEQVKGSHIPVVVNLLGTVERVCWAMGLETQEQLEALGTKLSKLQSPKPPKNLDQVLDFGKLLFDLVKSRPQTLLLGNAPVQEVIHQQAAVDLDQIPLIRPWQKDAGRVITLGLVITKDPENGIPNVSVYRLQQQSKNTLTVQWLSIRGGARHLRKAKEMGKNLEIAIALGVDPLLIMAAATPIPIDLSEWIFAGLYSGTAVELVKCQTLDLEVPAQAEFILEGTINPQEQMLDGPFGDHMGYYGDRKLAPLIRIGCVTHRHQPLYLTTFSGRPPKEEAMIAIALNRIYTPVLRQQVPEITDFFLPMEALSYKAAIISITKSYPGQARRAALAFWSALPQFTYTKFVIVVDQEINIRDPRQVVWAISSKVDPIRDVFILPNTPFDVLDFANQKLGLGSRMGIDATTKIYPEIEHEWGEALESDPLITQLCDLRWSEYGLADLDLNPANPHLFGYDLA
ncbi:MAG: UbiD family decarboxylase [Pseudanabaenaceae cyanobacterium bins.68]|nr:UbiD family decarboxylase [Pseudanabaenaceae cyanobacterium bins.68]